jgi:hypothetical protein
MCAGTVRVRRIVKKPELGTSCQSTLFSPVKPNLTCSTGSFAYPLCPKTW